uniref:Uncharacterized protein n=1 Tax=Cucumis melo TaxID=3656 RepID=A0A9I9EEN4_CUCME
MPTSFSRCDLSRPPPAHATTFLCLSTANAGDYYNAPPITQLSVDRSCLPTPLHCPYELNLIRGFFHGYSFITVLMILNHALSGIVGSMMLKYADNIVKFCKNPLEQ